MCGGQSVLLSAGFSLIQSRLFYLFLILRRMLERKRRAWPKGKMSEGRSGGSGRGTRRESWAPPDSGSAHRRIAGLYRVPTLDPKPFPAPPSHFLPSAASSPVVGEEPNLPCLRSSVS